MGQDWLYQFTNNLTNLTLANGGALTQFGLSLLSFIALMMLVNMVVNWGASTMTMTLQTQPVYFGDLIQFLIRLAVCCLLETYWVNPLPAPLYLAAEEHRKLFIPRKRNFHSYVAPSIMWHRYSPNGFINQTEFFRRHIIWSKGLEEPHQGNILFPMLHRSISTDLAISERFGFHFQIDFCIYVRGVERNVTQPRADGVDVHTGTEKMGRR